MLTRRTALGLFLAAPIGLTFSRPALAAAPEVFAEGGIALRGADPVAYFTSGAPAIGATEHALMWRGVEWRFADAANMEAFEMDPDRYFPAYGGHCAYAMSQGHIAPTVPEAWTIHDDRLFLNYSTEVRAIWQGDIAGNVVKADRHWTDLRGA